LFCSAIAAAGCQKARANGSGSLTSCQAAVFRACYNHAVTPYEQLVAQTDALAARLSARYAAHLACRAGCSGCCQHHLSVFAVEAAHIATALTAMPEDLRLRLVKQAQQVNEQETRGEAVACPLLVDERCSIYAARPLICRTQGLPLLFEMAEGESEVDFCPLNFTTESALAELNEAQLVPLDDLNLRLALVNLQYCRAQGITDEQSGQRCTISEIVLEAVG
jgi:uncharacterized protein